MDNQENTSNLKISKTSEVILHRIFKWGIAISILWIVALVLALGNISLVDILSYGKGFAIISVSVIVIFVVLYLTPVFILFRLSNNIKSAIKLSDGVFLERAFIKLRNLFRYIAIISTISILGYLIIKYYSYISAYFF